MSLEARVGMLVLAAGGILLAFTLLLSGVQTGDTYVLYADFDNPGSVQPGAPVRVAGMKVGSVEGIQFLGSRLDPQTGRRALVRIKLQVETRVKDSIHTDALFYVTSQGVLGEQFVAIDPGTGSKPLLREGAIVHGVDPPRLDLALSLGYELLQSLTEAIRNNREQLGSLMDDLSGIVRALNLLLTDNRENVNRIVQNVEDATVETNEILKAARGQYVDGPRMNRMLANLDRTLSVVSADIGPIMQNVKSVSGKADGVLGAIGPEQQEQLRDGVAGVAELVTKANRTLGDAQAIVAHIRQGEGTVGAMLMDEEIYDDVQEMIRDLKHNPWKFFWRE